MTARSAVRVVALAALAIAAYGADFAGLKPQGYVSDFAGVLDAETVSQLNAYCGRVEAATKAQLAIVTIDTLDGEPVEDVANLLFRKWGIGKKGEDNGALFLLAVKDRRSRLEVGYGLEPILPDGSAGSILREMRPALRAGDYRSALTTATAELGSRIATAKGVSLEGAPPLRRAKREKGIPAGAFLLLILFLIALSMIGGGRRNARQRYTPGSNMGSAVAGAILGQILGGGRRGGRGSGGFGGFDSGGGFGGFGGGSSGGGGASSGW